MSRAVLILMSVLLLAGAARARTPRADIARIHQLEDHRVGALEIGDMLRKGLQPVREAAALALGRIEDPAAFDALRRGLGDSEHEVRRLCAFSLGQLADPRGELALVVRLGREKHPAVRVEIWRALGRIGTTEALRHAEQARDQDRPVAVVAAGLMLRRAEKPAADVAWLVAALTDGDPEVRAAALYAFSRTHGDVPDAARAAAAKGLTGEQASERDAAVRVLARGLGSVSEQVLEALWSEGLADQWRAALVRGLARSKAKNPAETTAALRGVLRTALTRPLVSPTYHVALEAAKGLGKDAELRKEVFAALTAHNDASARRKAALLCALGGACPPPSKIAKLKLAAKGPDGVTAVIGALVGKDAPLAATAAVAAAEHKMTDPDVGKALIVAWAQTRGDIEAAQDVLRSAVKLNVDGVDKMLAEAADSANLALSRLARAELKKRGIELSVRPRPVPRFDDRAKALYTYSGLPKRAVVETSVGEFEVKLLTRWAPRTVKNLVELDARGYFDGLLFHRVVTDFVIQGGDPRGDGWGGPGYTIRCENNPVPYTTGTMGMALAGKDTGGSQWFITHSAQPHLFARYTVFGQIVRGQRVVDTIAQGDKIQSIKLLD